MSAVRWRGGAADTWVVAGGAGALFVSLFLTWSHQVTGAALITLGRLGALRGVPLDATAWQLYTLLDAVLAVFAAVLVAVALLGSWRARLISLAGTLAALAFVVHALAVPPTNGVLVGAPGGGYLATGAAAGPGETLAIAGLVVAAAGLAFSLVTGVRDA